MDRLLKLEEKYEELGKEIDRLKTTNESRLFSFIDWYEKTITSSFNNKESYRISAFTKQTPINQNVIKMRDVSFLKKLRENDVVHYLNRIVCERIIKYHMDKFKADHYPTWEPNWTNQRRKFYPYLSSTSNHIYVVYAKTQRILPRYFYFPKEFTEVFQSMRKKMEREYGLCLFKYYFSDGEVK